MNGHTYAVLLACLAVSAAAIDVIRVQRRLRERDNEDEASDAAAKRGFGLVVLYRAMSVVFALFLAGVIWNAEGDKHWTESKVVDATEEIAAGMESGGDAPAEADSFKSLVDSEVDGTFKANDLGLTDDWGKAPPGAVASCVLTGTKFDDRARD